MKIAIYGGAFNPPQLAHLFAITALLTRRDVDQVWVLPSATHAFAKQMAPFDARVEMLEAALKCFDPQRVKICDFELGRSGRSYDTLDALEALHPEHLFCFVMGADNLSEAHRWYRFDELVARWSLIIFGRPGHEAALARFEKQPWCCPGPSLPAISSTEIRAALRGEGDPSHLRWIPESCRAQAQRLYAQRATPPPKAPSLFIFGAGAAGRALASACRRAQLPLLGQWSRSPREGCTDHGDLPSPRASIWLLAVSDGALSSLAQRLSEGSYLPQVALHLAGRLGVEVLAPLAALGVSTGSLHPLQSLKGDGAGLQGAHCLIEGAEEALESARRLVEAWGAYPFQLPRPDRASYHAAAVLAANFMAPLMGQAVQLLKEQGLKEPEARALLAPLLEGSAANLGRMPAREALTGPFARGDLEAIKAHCQALRRRGAEALALYQSLARATAHWLEWSPEEIEALELACPLEI